VIEAAPLARRAQSKRWTIWSGASTTSDCTDRSEERLAEVVKLIRTLRPSVIVLLRAGGCQALARLRPIRAAAAIWPDMPVIAAAERLFPSDRESLQQAFGPKNLRDLRQSRG